MVPHARAKPFSRPADSRPDTLTADARRLRALSRELQQTSGPKREKALAGAFLVTGLLVAPAFRGLQGLTGHESLLAVATATLTPFSVAFALAGALGARALGITRAGPRSILICAAGGLLGGAFALLPFCWAWLRIDLPGESFVVMTLAVVGFLGCLIAPFHIVGLALDRARDQGGLARA